MKQIGLLDRQGKAETAAWIWALLSLVTFGIAALQFSLDNGQPHPFMWLGIAFAAISSNSSRIAQVYGEVHQLQRGQADES